MNTINNTNIVNVGPNFLLGGDTNFYGAFETGYTRLTESQADNDGRLKDNLNMPGLWNNPGYAPYHSQSPCGEATCIGSGGGMDDRFDMLLGSTSLDAALTSIDKVMSKALGIGKSSGVSMRMREER